MASNYRYWCGECSYRTPWLTESEGADRQIEHYAGRHPGIAPGGRIEVREQNNGGGPGCLGVAGILLFLLLLLATCQHASRADTDVVRQSQEVLATSGE